MQQGIAVIPKSNNHERLVANLNVLDFNLTDAEMKQLSALNINLRVSAVRRPPILSRLTRPISAE